MVLPDAIAWEGEDTALGVDCLAHPLPNAQDNARRLLVMLWCYLDDSGTDRTTPTVTMAGYVAPLSKWRHFEVSSRRLFKSYNVGNFHAKTFHDHDGEFKNWTIPQEVGFIDEWFTIAASFVTVGVTMSMARENFDKFRKTTRMLPNKSAYGHCFEKVIEHLLSDDTVGDLIIRDGISFFVETGAAGNAGVLEIFHKRKAGDGAAFLQQLSFIDKNSCKAIQLADFLAFYSRRHGSTLITTNVNKMASFLEIAKDRVRTIAQLGETFVQVPTKTK